MRLQRYKIPNLINYITAFIIGAITLSLFIIAHMVTIRLFPVNLKGFVFPVILGGILGLIIETWRKRLKKDTKMVLLLNQTLRIIQNVNQLIAREHDSTKLIQELCNIITEDKRYCKAVWIYLLNGEQKADKISGSGWNGEFLTISKQIKDGKLPDCLMNALEKPDLLITENPFSTCKQCPLSIKCQNAGALTIRLEYGGKVYGVMWVVKSRDYIFNETEHAMLKEIASDIAFGLRSIELEETRKRAEIALKESEKRFRDLVENSLTGIFIIQNNHIIYKNPEQERLFGPLPESFVFKNFENVHPDDVASIKKEFERILKGEIQILTTNFRFYPVGKMGSKPDMKWVYCKANLIKFQGKDAILLNMMDITRYKELENLLLMQDKMASLGHITIGIAHEIRNPLSGINIYLNTLERVYDKAENSAMVRKIIGQIQAASSKIESVIKRVMDFSKPSEPHLTLIDVNKPIEEAISLSAVTLKKSNIQIEKLFSENLPNCLMDSHMICQVILNLITNAAEAMKYIEGKKIIEIASRMDDNSIVISVSDSGLGIPSSVRGRLFDPFYTTKQENTGIGLSLCQRIITDHGGSIHVTKSKWGGAEFLINIPLNR